MECKERLVEWLKNAYCLELSIAETLEKHAQAAEDLPEIQNDLAEHISLTNDQAERVRNEIERLGGDVSSIKTTFSKILGDMSGVASELPRDRLVKNAITELGTEHLEMATYMAIANIAEICGEEESAEMARKIAEEEKTTGEMLAKKMNMIISHYLKIEAEEE